MNLTSFPASNPSPHHTRPEMRIFCPDQVNPAFVRRRPAGRRTSKRADWSRDGQKRPFPAGGDLQVAAQANVQIDAEMGKKDHFRL